MTVRDWEARARVLSGELSAIGKLESPKLRAAVEAVPRHVFVPVFYELKDGAGWQIHAETGPRKEHWLEQVYANRSLVTQIGPVHVGGRDRRGATSSSSAPSLMTRMIEALDVKDGHRVLEIGTGTGWNAALLCHMLGDDHVFTVDVDGELVLAARENLAHLGYHPVVVCVDGFDGLPVHSPYDRIIATCAVSWVPWSWAQQTAISGRVLVDLKVHAAAGNLVLLERLNDRLEGRFDAGYATFMHMRTPEFEATWKPVPGRDKDSAVHSTTSSSLTRPWENPVLWFLLHLHQPARIDFGFTMNELGAPGNAFFTTPDGSWCEVSESDDGQRDVWQGGPRQLWSIIESAADMWYQHGEPGWERFGVTVTRDGGNTVWLDDPNGEHRWRLAGP